MQSLPSMISVSPCLFISIQYSTTYFARFAYTYMENGAHVHISAYECMHKYIQILKQGHWRADSSKAEVLCFIAFLFQLSYNLIDSQQPMFKLGTRYV